MGFRVVHGTGCFLDVSLAEDTDSYILVGFRVWDSGC